MVVELELLGCNGEGFETRSQLGLPDPRDRHHQLDEFRAPAWSHDNDRGFGAAAVGVAASKLGDGDGRLVLQAENCANAPRQLARGVGRYVPIPAKGTRQCLFRCGRGPCRKPALGARGATQERPELLARPLRARQPPQPARRGKQPSPGGGGKCRRRPLFLAALELEAGKRHPIAVELAHEQRGRAQVNA
jgi:hypothetical protein